MEENVVVTDKKPQLWLAILCAVGLGLAGCLLWGLLYYYGYIAWIAAFIVVLAAAWGYKKFNLKMDKKGYAIVSAISFVEIIATMFIVIAILVADVENGFNILFNDVDFVTAFITDIILSVVMIVLALVSFRQMEKRMVKKTESDNLAKYATSQTQNTAVDTNEVKDATETEEPALNAESNKKNE
ncbi:MAG: hypothetical protein ACI4TT_01675 [Christensenellales bacterium]